MNLREHLDAERLRLEALAAKEVRAWEEIAYAGDYAPAMARAVVLTFLEAARNDPSLAQFHGSQFLVIDALSALTNTPYDKWGRRF